jgi:hypothetical protein
VNKSDQAVTSVVEAVAAPDEANQTGNTDDRSSEASDDLRHAWTEQDGLLTFRRASET